MGKALAFDVAILDRREQRAEVEDCAVRILMIGADHRRDEIGGIAADLRHVRAALEAVAVWTIDSERQLHAPHVIEREPLVEEANERADRSARIVVLGFPEEQARTAFDIAQIDIVAE